VVSGDDVIEQAVEESGKDRPGSSRWEVEDRIDAACDRRRTSLTAMMALTLALASVLLTIATRHRTPTSDPKARGAAPGATVADDRQPD
jgi:hypothetical protein